MTDAEMIRLAAEKVMGWKPWPAKDQWGEDHMFFVCPPDTALIPFDPLANDADSCRLLDKMAADYGYYLAVIHRKPPGADAADYIGCTFNNDEGMVSQSFHPLSPENRRRAILMAALKAVGVDVDG